MVKKKEKKEEFIVLKHELVPQSILMSKEEAETLLKTYRIKPFQLPKIKDSDSQVKALNAKAGDIIKIIRKSPTAGTAEYYRYVIKG